MTDELSPGTMVKLKSHIDIPWWNYMPEKNRIEYLKIENEIWTIKSTKEYNFFTCYNFFENERVYVEPRFFNVVRTCSFKDFEELFV